MKKKLTDQTIWQAFFILMVEEKNYFSQVRVDDICKEADIHRSTFYRHFEDKYQLLEFGLTILWQDYFKLDERDKVTKPFETANLFFHDSQAKDLIKQNSLDEEFIRVVDSYFLKQMTHSFMEILANQTDLELPKDLLAHFMVSGIQVIDEWQESQLEKIPLAELDTIYQKLVLKGVVRE